MFIYAKEKGMKMLWCYQAIKVLRNLLQTAGMIFFFFFLPSIGYSYFILGGSMNKFTYSMLYFNTFLFDSQIQFWPFKLFFTEMIVFPAVLLLIVVFVYPHGIYSEPPCMSLGQKNNPKCKFCFTSVLCRYLWEMAVLCNKVSRTHIFIKRGVDKPFLYSNALLFPSVLVRLHCSAHKERKLPPELLAS